MTPNANEIISYIEKNYPLVNKVTVSNCSDLNIESKCKLLSQLIFGIAPEDRFTPGIRQYEYQIKTDLAVVTGNVKCLPWGYEDLNELKPVLITLSDHFHANLEIDKMIERVKRVKANRYYIVITVVLIPFLSTE